MHSRDVEEFQSNIYIAVWMCIRVDSFVYTSTYTHNNRPLLYYAGRYSSSKVFLLLLLSTRESPSIRHALAPLSRPPLLLLLLLLLLL